jgi:uncharacterized ferredoxin-like protein
MGVIRSDSAEMEGLLQVANLMAVSARTAPKAHGVDDISVLILTGPEKDALADEMAKIGDERRVPTWRRDSENVRDSAAVVLIGVNGLRSAGLNCGGCGFRDCGEYERAKKTIGPDYEGPNCIFKAIDLGIAICSSAKTASIMNVDNRIMYRTGVAARRLGLLRDSIVLGVPISAKGKNIYFDRKWEPRRAE